MSTIINGTSSAITFPDSSVQNTSAIVSGYVPYANLPAGSVLQVVNGIYNGTSSSSSSTYSDTGVTVTITPKFATSKILVETFVSIWKNATNAQGSWQVVKNGSSLILFEAGAPYTGTTAGNDVGAAGTTYLDSPATTSALTYKVQQKLLSGSGLIGINDNSGYSTITVMEIAG